MKFFFHLIFFAYGLGINGACLAQEVMKSVHTTFNFKDEAAELNLGGNVDFFNSFVYLPWPDSYKAYQNLVEISIHNPTSNLIESPFISINDSNLWQDPSSIEDNLIRDDFDMTALLLWKCFTEHSIHRYYPYDGFRIGTPIELLTNFGYGICYNKSAAFTRLPSNESQNFFDLFANKHTVSEYRRGEQSAVVDTDLNSFYLNHSNSQLSSKDIISNDRYLIKRTHHYGRQYAYDEILNEYIAYFYSDNPSNNPISSIIPVDYSFKYHLVPGENLVLDYGPGGYFFSEYHYSMDPEEIANGRFSYDWNSASGDYYINHAGLANVHVAQDRLVKTDPEQPGSFSFKLTHGFQIVFFDLYLDFGNQYTPSTLTVEISPDSTNWLRPTKEVFENSRLDLQFDLQKVSFKGAVFVRIVANQDDTAFELTNFGYVSHFQVNRLALPQLKCGINTVRALYDNHYDVPLRVDLRFKERLSVVPSAIKSPAFPSDGQVAYGPIRRFSWEPSEGDTEIVNYEFFLTKDTLSNLPLSPNFLAYTVGASYSEVSLSAQQVGRSANLPLLNPGIYKQSRFVSNKGARTKEDLRSFSEFAVHEEGFFNSGETYFWRVRPLHSTAVWGPWSSFFSFTSRKIMPPTQLRATENQISWQPGKQGANTKLFEIYGSNEYLGFEPTALNLIATTSDTVFAIDNQSFTFFRIVAVDSVGFKSEVSEYISRPYPYLKNRPEDVHPDTVFRYTVEFTKAFYPLVSHDDQYIENIDKITFQIKRAPPWLKFNYSDWTFEGTPTEEVLKRELYAGKNHIDFEFMSVILPQTREYVLNLNYGVFNNSPELLGKDTAIYCNNDFAFHIEYSDKDQQFGDSVSFRLLGAPEWLRYDITSNYVLLHGQSPGVQGAFTVTLVGYDKGGDSTKAEVSIRLLPNKVSFETFARNDEVVDLALSDILPVELLSREGAFVQIQDNINKNNIFIEDGRLLLYGDYCSSGYPISFVIPLIITLSDLTGVQFELAIEVLGKKSTSPIAYHAVNTDWINIINVNCKPVHFRYRVVDTKGQALMKGQVTMEPEESRRLSLQGVSPGVYVFEMTPPSHQGWIFRFVKQ